MREASILVRECFKQVYQAFKYRCHTPRASFWCKDTDKNRTGLIFSVQMYIIAKNKGPWPKYFGNIQFYIAEKMMKFAPLLKHPSYAEEKEWRLIKDLTEYQSSNYKLPPHMFINNNSHEFKIRARKNLLIPYVEIPFNLRDGGYSNIKEITVGPTPHKERAAEACRILMANNEYIRIANVSNSAIPYVNW